MNINTKNFNNNVLTKLLLLLFSKNTNINHFSNIKYKIFEKSIYLKIILLLINEK